MEGSLERPRKSQKSGNNILFTVRTTGSLHSQRLPLIFQTWLSTVNSSNVVLVTDEEDRVLKYRAQEAGDLNFHLCCDAGQRNNNLCPIPDGEHKLERSNNGHSE